MMTSNSGRRILIALDVHSANEAELSTLISIARRLNASLAGLYIEDSQLMSVAGLPFSTEINYLSAEEKLLEPEELLRINKIASARARQLLEQLTSREKLSWTFTVESGELAALALSHQGCDVFFPGRSRARFNRSYDAISARQQLTLIYHNAEAFDRMLEVTQQLSVNGMVSDITIVSETPLPAEIAERLPVQGVRLHFQLVRSTGPEALPLLKLPRGSVVLMARAALTGMTARQLSELPDQLPYPLMLVE